MREGIRKLVGKALQFFGLVFLLVGSVVAYALVDYLLLDCSGFTSLSQWVVVGVSAASIALLLAAFLNNLRSRNTKAAGLTLLLLILAVFFASYSIMYAGPMCVA